MLTYRVTTQVTAQARRPVAGQRKSVLRATPAQPPLLVERRRARLGVGRKAAGALAASASAAVAAAGACAATTSVTAKSVAAALIELEQATQGGADIVELRLDYLDEFIAERDLPVLLRASKLPAIVTYRPNWEGGLYTGEEEPRLAALLTAAKLGAAFIDVELKAAERFAPLWAAAPQTSTKLILSSHNYKFTPPLAELLELHARAVTAGADIVKLATMAQQITDVDVLSKLLEKGRESRPTIALAMGESGQVSRLLAPKLGSFLTFGALGAGKESAPGQPRLSDLKGLYRMQQQGASTRSYGVIGQPISHSRSPAIHNAALAALGLDGVYVPLLVADLPSFLQCGMIDALQFDGFSVTIPHKEAALACCKEVDPVAARIGAVNTLVRLPSGGWKGYNTDWLAAIDAIEKGLGGPGSLQGRSFLLVGAGGAGRALAFGAAQRGASVLVANRSPERAIALAVDVGGVAVPWEELQAGRCRADVLANTTSMGMAADADSTPVPAAALGGFKLVFDAVYTPLETRLLREAAAAGAVPVSGLDMFIGQAAEQFRLFTGRDAPLGVMRDALLASLGARK